MILPRTTDSLDVPDTTQAHYKAQIMHAYRFRRAGLKESPSVAAAEVERDWMAVVAECWRGYGEVNEVAGFAYLVAHDWYEAATRLEKRRAARAARADDVFALADAVQRPHLRSVQ